jgi:hypothetical protein
VISFRKVLRLIFCLMYGTCPILNLLLRVVALKYLLIERRNRVVGNVLPIREIPG